MRLRGFIYALIAVAMSCANTSKVIAKNVQTPKLYAFGIASSFNDSILYITDIQEIDSVWINPKSKFVVECSSYSNQLRQYFTNNGDSHRTCVFYYAYDKKDIDKKYNKLKARYVKGGNVSIKYLSKDEFAFKRTTPYIYNEDEADDKAASKKAKKHKDKKEKSKKHKKHKK